MYKYMYTDYKQYTTHYGDRALWAYDGHGEPYTYYERAIQTETPCWTIADTRRTIQTDYECHYNQVYVLYMEYSKLKDDDICSQIKRYYTNVLKAYRADQLEKDLSNINQYYPHIPFKQIYYPCLKKHIEKMKWIGK